MNSSANNSDAAASKFVARVDPPHRTVAGPTHLPDPIEAELANVQADGENEAVWSAAGLSADSAHEQLRLQTSQLIVHLQTRQRDLDRREALLNSQLARQENELRVHRLWMNEREVDVNEQEQQFRKQIQELEQRIAVLSTAEATLESSQQQVLSQESERETYLQLHEQRLNERERKLAAGERALQTAYATFNDEKQQFTESVRYERQQLAFLTESQWQTHRRLLGSLERHRESLERKERGQLAATTASSIPGSEIDSKSRSSRNHSSDQQRLELLVKRERQLDQQIAELDHERHNFERERGELSAEIEKQRTLLFEERNKFRAEVAEANARLTERSQSLDQQRGVLERLHAECSERHREALETRLAAEQTWAELSGKASAATIAQVTAGVRRQIAEEFRDSLRAMSERRQELLRLAQGLEQRRAELQERYSERQDWLAQRQTELEEQARQLHQRECELEEQSRELRARTKEWKQEKQILLRQIREQHA